MADDPLSRALDTAIQAGQILLENGASTARAEETVMRIGHGLGAEQVEAFATPTGLFVTFHAGEEDRTRIQRIERIAIDLSKIEQVLTVSRAVVQQRFTQNQALVQLHAIGNAPPPFGFGVSVLATGLCCGSTAGLLGGGLREVLATAVSAGLSQAVGITLARYGLNRLIVTSIIAALMAAGALVAASMGAIAEIVLIAAILVLTPGVLIVSAVSDLFQGDTLSGLARAAMALLSVAAIAAGVWLVLASSKTEIASASIRDPAWPLALPLAACTTLGFAMLFGVPLRRLPACAVTGMCAYAASRLAGGYGAPPAVTLFAGGVVVAALAEILARLLQAPSILFSTPGIITLVPGGVAFRTMLAFVQNDISTGTTNLVVTMLLAFALAAGLGVVTALTHLRTRRT